MKDSAAFHFSTFGASPDLFFTIPDDAQPKFAWAYLEAMLRSDPSLTDAERFFRANYNARFACQDDFEDCGCAYNYGIQGDYLIVTSNVGGEGDVVFSGSILRFIAEYRTN